MAPKVIFSPSFYRLSENDQRAVIDANLRELRDALAVTSDRPARLYLQRRLRFVTKRAVSEGIFRKEEA